MRHFSLCPQVMRYLLGICLGAVLSSAAMGQPAAGEERTLAERLGYARDARLLLVHADDLGVAHAVNAASTAALETGLVSSASIMVPCPWFPEIAAYARAHPEADLGIHLTLTSEWKYYRWGPVLPESDVPTLVDGDGYLHADAGEAARRMDPAQAEAEIRAQVERALAFGIRPTHLDSHMGTLFQTPALFEAYLRVGRDYGIPVLLPRESLAAEPAAPLRALLKPGDVLIDRIAMATPDVPAAEWEAFYSGLVAALQPGVTEIILHAAYDGPEMQAVAADHPDFGAEWRQRDFDFFTSDTFRRLLAEHDVRLVTWREIGEALRAP